MEPLVGALAGFYTLAALARRSNLSVDIAGILIAAAAGVVAFRARGIRGLAVGLVAADAVVAFIVLIVLVRMVV
jgi:hypothetical protein